MRIANDIIERYFNKRRKRKMSWFNYYGLAIFVLMMIPNVVYAAKNKGFFGENVAGKAVSVVENVARIGSFVFLIFNVPYTYAGFWFENALVVYLSVNGILLFFYLSIWLVMRNKETVLRAVLLSVIPSAILIFSGILVRSAPLTAFALTFAPCHIYISVVNSSAAANKRKKED